MTGLQAYGCTSCLDPSVDCGSMMGKGCRVSRLGESELRVVDEDVVLHESDDEVAVCGFEPALPEHAKRAPQELTLEGADATFEGADVASEGAVEEQSTTTVTRPSYGEMLQWWQHKKVTTNVRWHSRQIQLREQQKKSAYAS
eukprot:GEMP01044478.1.p1 GENE.GEMP01044478.1~~GEMP01044478.1.p1  ORF type:complete len:143 (+),score=39.55 GEMP01044478.1:130-558(+)